MGVSEPKKVSVRARLIGGMYGGTWTDIGLIGDLVPGRVERQYTLEFFAKRHEMFAVYQTLPMEEFGYLVYRYIGSRSEAPN